MISVVIPAYNAEMFVADAIESVLTQTYSNIECIVVDDGSLDGTADVVKRFDSVKLVQKSNGGDASARNTGIAVARGNLVAFLDADDLWLPRKLESQMGVFDSTPEAVLVYSGVHVIADEGRFIGIIRPGAGENALRSTLVLEKPYLTAIGSTGVVVTDIARQVGGFDERLRASSDWDFGCKVAARGRVVGIKEPLAMYRQHEAQIHRNLDHVEADVRLVVSEALGPKGWAKADLSRRRALANLHVSLAASRIRQGQKGAAVRELIRIAFLRPDRLFAAIWRRMRPGGPWDLGGPARLW